jgi:hypothetical protein
MSFFQSKNEDSEFVVLVYDGSILIYKKEFASYGSAFRYAATMCGGFNVDILHPNGDLEEVSS